MAKRVTNEELIAAGRRACVKVTISQSQKGRGQIMFFPGIGPSSQKPLQKRRRKP
jgi:hypothetical protein